MLDLLKKINEEKLEGLGFLSYQGRSRVETILDAAQIFEQNLELKQLLNQRENELISLKENAKMLSEKLQTQKVKTDKVVAYKVQADQKILVLKRQELEYHKAVEKLREQAEFQQLQLTTESRRKEEFRAQLACCREAVSHFISSADDISDVVNFLTGDLLL